MSEKFGIKETKDVFHFLFGVAQASIDISQDGKLGATAITKMIAPLTSLPAAISGLSEVGNELSDLSEAEKLELYKMIEDELHIPNAIADLIVKKIWKILIEMSDFIRLVKK